MTSYANWDLALLLFIFLHRSYLKNYGLWRDDVQSKEALDRAVEATKLAKRDRSTYAIDVAQVTSKNTNAAAAVAANSSSHARFNPLPKIRRFYNKMTDPRYNKKVDVYVFMFLCEFLSFWIIIFGYNAFGPGTGMGSNAIEFIRQNRIPVPFIGMIMLQFLFIIIDRSLFLRKQVFGKFIFLMVHVILIHIWLFFVLPVITFSNFNDYFARKFLYVMKCLYFALSAYQIRSGYPSQILGNFLTRKYNYINLYLFKAYLVMPFLYELRSVMDWMWTDSSLSLYHWMELEDIYSKMFVLKCWRRAELEYPTPRGHDRSVGNKYLIGMFFLLFFSICFWGPLSVASFIDTTYVINAPAECSFSLRFSSYPPIYTSTARGNQLIEVDSNFIIGLKHCHNRELVTRAFIENFKAPDVRKVSFPSFSEKIWDITAPSLKEFISEISELDEPLPLTSLVKCRRISKVQSRVSNDVKLYYERSLSREEQSNLSMTLLGGYGTSKPVLLKAILPRFLFASKAQLVVANGKLGESHTFLNLSVILRRSNESDSMWWQVVERGTATPPCYASVANLTQAQMNSTSSNRRFSIFTFNERVSDTLLGRLFSSYGIIGMYAAYIFVASRIIRMFYSDISYTIHIQELPYVDRILYLCQDIYLVRQAKQFKLEEQLFAKLIFLFRSTETMIKWTRHPRKMINWFTDEPHQGDLTDSSTGERIIKPYHSTVSCTKRSLHQPSNPTDSSNLSLTTLPNEETANWPSTRSRQASRSRRRSGLSRISSENTEERSSLLPSSRQFETDPLAPVIEPSPSPFGSLYRRSAQYSWEPMVVQQEVDLDSPISSQLFRRPQSPKPHNPEET